MILLDDEEILERVDEYTLYCFYLNFEPQVAWAYNSPIRPVTDPDDRPSWSMFYSRHRYLTFKWKDNGRGVSGDIFDLVQIRFGLPSRVQAIGKVAHDFGLMLDPGMDIPPKIKLYEAPPDLPVDIRIKSKPTFSPQVLAYYSQINIGPATLHRYHSTSIACYWTLRKDPVTGVEQWSNPRFPRGIGMAYRIGDRYQIYQPNESKDWKFRTSFREEDVMGLKQLRGRFDLLLVTKAMKEVQFFDTVGVDALASHSEHRGLPAFVINEIFPKYKQVAIWNDNDGKESSEKFYPDKPKLYVPVSSGEKDPTDFRRHYGAADTYTMINQVFYGAGILPPATFRP